jgi:hypothetical protein
MQRKAARLVERSSTQVARRLPIAQPKHLDLATLAMTERQGLAISRSIRVQATAPVR